MTHALAAQGGRAAPSLAPAVISALPAGGGGDPSGVRGASRCVLLGFCTCLPVQIDPEAARLPLPRGSLPSPGGLCHTEVPQCLRGEISHCDALGPASSTAGQRMQTLFCVFYFPPHFLPLGNFRLNGGRFYRRRDVLQQGEEKEKRARCVQGTSPPRCLGQDRRSVAMGSRGCREPGAGRHRGLLAGRILPTAPQPGEPRDCAEPGRLRVTAKATSPRSAGRCRGDP